MDPVSVIVTALAGGAAAALKDTASQAIKDGYAGLKALVLRRLQKAQPNAEVVLAEFERDSETWEKPVRKSLADSAGDQELVGTSAAPAPASPVETKRAGQVLRPGQRRRTRPDHRRSRAADERYSR